MQDAAKMLIMVLDSLDLVQMADGDRAITQLSSLKGFINLPIYQQSIYLNYYNDPQSLSEIANALLYKAANLYTLKEYQHSFELIMINIFNCNPINQELIKLIIANFHHLGYFAIAASMYTRFYELSGEIDSLYFAGICYSLLDNPEPALANFQQFLALSEVSAAAKHNFKQLSKSCQGLIKHIQGLEKTSAPAKQK